MANPSWFLFSTIIPHSVSLILTILLFAIQLQIKNLLILSSAIILIFFHLLNLITYTVFDLELTKAPIWFCIARKAGEIYFIRFLEGIGTLFMIRFCLLVYNLKKKRYSYASKNYDSIFTIAGIFLALIPCFMTWVPQILSSDTTTLSRNLLASTRKSTCWRGYQKPWQVFAAGAAFMIPVCVICAISLFYLIVRAWKFSVERMSRPEFKHDYGMIIRALLISSCYIFFVVEIVSDTKYYYNLTYHANMPKGAHFNIGRFTYAFIGVFYFAIFGTNSESFKVIKSWFFKQEEDEVPLKEDV